MLEVTCSQSRTLQIANKMWGGWKFMSHFLHVFPWQRKKPRRWPHKMDKKKCHHENVTFLSNRMWPFLWQRVMNNKIRRNYTEWHVYIQPILPELQVESHTLTLLTWTLLSWFDSIEITIVMLRVHGLRNKPTYLKTYEVTTTYVSTTQRKVGHKTKVFFSFFFLSFFLAAINQFVKVKL